VREPGKTSGAIRFALNFLWLLSLFHDKESDTDFSCQQKHIYAIVGVAPGILCEGVTNNQPNCHYSQFGCW